MKHTQLQRSISRQMQTMTPAQGGLMAMYLSSLPSLLLIVVLGLTAFAIVGECGRWGDSEWFHRKYPNEFDKWERGQWEHIHHPIFLKGHPCLESWTYNFGHVSPEQWAAEFGTLSNVYASKSSSFTYHDFKVVDKRFPNFHAAAELQAVHASKLLRSKSSQEDMHFYYSGNIRNSNFEKLKPRINFNCLFSGIPIESTNSMNTMVWIGGENITATAHYDVVHNIYTQLVGHKRVRLLAPNQFTKLGTTPNSLLIE
jgi:hypothetical protein